MICEKPDRDEPKLKCGYPMPCPHHTATIDLKERTITVPGTNYAKAAVQAHYITRIAKALGRFLHLPGYGEDDE